MRDSSKPLLIYDGDCAFCQRWVNHWKRLTGDRVDYAPFQEVEAQFSQISHEEFERGIQLVMPDGTIYSKAEAVFQLMQGVRRRGWMAVAYHHVPGFKLVSDSVYRLVAAHRDAGFWLTAFLWGEHIGPHSYVLTRWLFLRALAFIYLIAFGSLAVQILGLVGSNGILPVADYLERVAENVPESARFLAAPTLLWLDSSDAFLQFLCYGGVVMAILLLFDIAPAVMCALMWVFYLSLLIAGQTFLSFQWDVLLLETGFLAILLAPPYLLPTHRLRREPSLVTIYLFRWLLFRLMFRSGAVKLLSGDPTWHSLTALNYHYWTQPIPTPVAWYLEQLPDWTKTAGVAFTFFVELIVPFFYFAPRRPRFVAAAFTVALMLLIIVSGNYTFFNWLTIALCIPLLDDDLIRGWLPKRWVETLLGGLPPRRTILTAIRTVAFAVVALFIVFASGTRFLDTFSRGLMDSLPEQARDAINQASRLRVIGSYGLFANMTTSRPEILVEGSNDGETWLAYDFKYKAGEIDEPLLWVAPHQPRLDWQMWFAALGGTYRNVPWFVSFARRLLEGSPEVLALLEHDPFPDQPPRYVRATLMDYRFSDWETRNLIGAWWTRTNPREFLPQVSLENFRRD